MKNYMKNKIHILTYDAPHRKTQDLLLKLKMKGYTDINVYATPWEERKNFQPLIPHRHLIAENISLKDLCKNLSYTYTPIDIADIKLDDNDIMLIGGAGIIPKELIGNKIINSHPAYLPNVRGLDSLKWAIINGQPIGVTTHIINEHTDAGHLIRREFVPLYYWDTFHSVAVRQYEMEIQMLVDAIEELPKAELTPLPTTGVVTRRMPHKYELKLMKKFQKIIDDII